MKRSVLAFVMVAVLLLTACTPASTDSEIPGDAFQVYSDQILYARKVAKITGPDALTNTMSKFNVGGTDLGFPYYDEYTGRLTLIFGDTYSTTNLSGNWRSNVALYTTQKDYSGGLAFEGALTPQGAAESGVAVQLTPGASSVSPLLKGEKHKTPGTHTCIPTGVVMVGETTYLFYMEIDKNAFPATGGWGVYCNRVIKSEDHGASWTQVEDLYWQAKDENDVMGEAPNFAQIYPLKVDGYVYLYGLEGGRSGGTKLARVACENIESKDSYEYFTGYDADGQAQWVQGGQGLDAIKDSTNAYILQPQCAEMCVTYNAYLGKYLAIFKQSGALVFCAADTPYGPFDNPEIIFKNEDFGGYGGFTCEQLSDQGGKRIWVIMSQWLRTSADPVYNVTQIEIVFK